METQTLPAKKLDGLMADIRTLIIELGRLHQLATCGDALGHEQQANWNREWNEIERTICSKLLAVKYFATLGDSFIKVSAGEGQQPLRLEIVTVYQGSDSLSFPAEFELQVYPITGWYPLFRSCEPCTATEYQAAVDMALEKGAVVV